MRIFTRIASMCAAVVMLATATITMAPQRASAVDGNPSYCDPEAPLLINQNIDAEVPVILVHGLGGNAGHWGDTRDTRTLGGKIHAMPGAAVVHKLQYNSQNVNTGRRLAKTIECASKLSIAEGGKGQVVVVGYSQGGMIARYALDYTFPDGHNIKGLVGQVVTLGSPNSILVGVPAFPQETTVYTIASNVTNVYRDWRGNVIERRVTNSDGLFTVGQATYGWTADFDPTGGGTQTISCERYLVRYLPGVEIQSANATCEHGQMVTNPNSKVHKATTDAIQIFVDWNNRPIGKSLTVGGLTTSYNGDWAQVDYGASGEGNDSSAQDTTNYTDCTNCDTVPPPKSYAYLDTIRMDWCADAELMNCITSSNQISGPAPVVTVGGRTPDSSARFSSPGYAGSGLAWCFDTEEVCLVYRRGPLAQLDMSFALNTVLTTATWAD